MQDYRKLSLALFLIGTDRSLEPRRRPGADPVGFWRSTRTQGRSTALAHTKRTSGPPAYHGTKPSASGMPRPMPSAIFSTPILPPQARTRKYPPPTARSQRFEPEPNQTAKARAKLRLLAGRIKWKICRRLQRTKSGASLTPIYRNADELKSAKAIGNSSFSIYISPSLPTLNFVVAAATKARSDVRLDRAIILNQIVAAHESDMPQVQL